MTHSLKRSTFSEPQKKIFSRKMFIIKDPESNLTDSMYKTGYTSPAVQYHGNLSNTQYQGNLTFNLTPKQMGNISLDEIQGNRLQELTIVDRFEKLPFHVFHSPNRCRRQSFIERDAGVTELVKNYFHLITADTLSKKLSVFVYDKDNALIIKPSKKTYLFETILGKGAGKVTCKYSLVNPKESFSIFTKPKYRAISLPNSKPVANEKQFVQNNLNESSLNIYLKQNRDKLPHVNVITSIIAFVRKNGVVFGFVNKVYESDVENYLKVNRLSELQLGSIALQMALAVQELHHINFLHRDIKPDNFLIKKKVNGELEVKITDFGLSAVQNDYRFENKDYFILTSDPLRHDKPANDATYFSKESDIYQLGSALLLVLTSTSMKSFINMFKQEASHLTPTEWKLNPERWELINRLDNDNDRQFILRMLNPLDASVRPTSKEVVYFLRNRTSSPTSI